MSIRERHAKILPKVKCTLSEEGNTDERHGQSTERVPTSFNASIWRYHVPSCTEYESAEISGVQPPHAESYPELWTPHITRGKAEVELFEWACGKLLCAAALPG